MENLIVTPKTKIYDLLEAYPQLEDVLIASAPVFNKLKNPVLRKTITKITTLSQTAIIGGLKVEDLVNLLRRKVGQDVLSGITDNGSTYNTSQPAWYRADQIVDTIDISDMLNRGEQPVHEVLSAINKLEEGEILEIVAPFIPAPLIDKTISLQYEHWLLDNAPATPKVYFCKPA